MVGMRLAVLFAITAQFCSAQGPGLKQLSVISLKVHPDAFYLFNWEHYRRGPLFDTGIGPTGEFIALVGMQDSRWQLLRIRDWWTAKTVVDRVSVPGFGFADETNRWGLTPKVLISPDSKFAISIALAAWPNPSEKRGDAISQQPDALLTAVDLRTFKTVKTVRTSELGLRTWQWRIDKTGNLRADGVNPAKVAQPVGTERWVALLSIPDLRVLERCDYSVALHSGTFNPVLHEPTSSACTTVAQAYSAFDDEGLMNIKKQADLKARLDARCGIEGVSQDEKYAFGSCRNGHDVIWGYSWGPESTNVYSISNGKVIAVLKHKQHGLTDIRLATVDGKDYLLAVVNAEVLTVYRIAE
jgi:hypothetical protein